MGMLRLCGFLRFDNNPISGNFDHSNRRASIDGISAANHVNQSIAETCFSSWHKRSGGDADLAEQIAVLSA